MNTTTTISMVEAAYQGRFDADDDTTFAKILHDDIVMEQPKSLPFGGVFHGKEAVLDCLASVRGCWSKSSFKLERLTSGDNLLMAYCHMLIASDQTGISYGGPFVELLRFADGKIIEMRPFYFDTGRIAEVFGKDTL